VTQTGWATTISTRWSPLEPNANANAMRSMHGSMRCIMRGNMWGSMRGRMHLFMCLTHCNIVLNEKWAEASRASATVKAPDGVTL
jgi:hypothetical protein